MAHGDGIDRGCFAAWAGRTTAGRLMKGIAHLAEGFSVLRLARCTAHPNSLGSFVPTIIEEGPT